MCKSFGVFARCVFLEQQLQFLVSSFQNFSNGPKILKYLRTIDIFHPDFISEENELNEDKKKIKNCERTF